LDQNTGLYRIGPDNIGVTANGNKVLDIATTGLTVTGALGASSLTSPAGNDLTLGLGTGGTALTLTNSTLAATFAGAVNVTGVLSSTGTINTSAGSAIIAGSSAAPAPLAPSATRGIMHTAGSTDTIISWGTASTHNGYIYGSAAITQILSVPDSLQMVVAGANRGTFSSTGLAVAGALTVSSSTAGSAGAGALVVTGGLATGAASYFGGVVTAGGNVLISNPSSSAFSSFQAQNNNGGNATIQIGTSGSARAGTYFGSAEGNLSLIFANGTSSTGLGIGTFNANPLVLGTNNTAALTINATTQAATFAGAVTIAGTVIHTLSATPASASATGTVGTMSWDASYIYICTAANTWKRVAIATW
jgi:hypothetical protein